MKKCRWFPSQIYGCQPAGGGCRPRACLGSYRLTRGSLLMEGLRTGNPEAGSWGWNRHLDIDRYGVRSNSLTTGFAGRGKWGLTRAIWLTWTLSGKWDYSTFQRKAVFTLKHFSLSLSLSPSLSSKPGLCLLSGGSKPMSRWEKLFCNRFWRLLASAKNCRCGSFNSALAKHKPALQRSMHLEMLMAENQKP